MKLDAETIAALTRLNTEAAVHKLVAQRMEDALWALMETHGGPDGGAGFDLYRELMRKDELGMGQEPQLAWGLAYAILSYARANYPITGGSKNGDLLLTWEDRLRVVEKMVEVTTKGEDE